MAGLSREERLAQRQALGLGGKDLVLGNVSRVVPWKGHDYAIDVVGALKESFPNLKLMIVGDAKTPSEIGFKERLVKKVRRLGLAEDIIFTGWVKDPARYFAAFDLYLLTSMPLEGVPGAVIEAALAGVPVVGFDCYGVREIPGVQATLVPPKDIRGLINALRKQLRYLDNGHIHSNDNHYIAVQDQMRQQFDMGRMVRETWNVYQHSLGN